MTLNGAIKQLHELRSAEDMPIHYKPAIAEVINVLLMDAREVKHGRWIDENFEPHGLVFYPYRCDQCGEHNSIPSDYCPSCGADMRGEAK